MCGEGQLGDQDWGGETGEGETETDKESAPDEHANVLSGGLDSRADKHQAASKEDGPSSTESVVEVWRKW